MELFNVKDVNFAYPDRSVNTLNDINLTIEKGEFVVLCGSTGSGKSTLLRMLKPELSPAGSFEGEIRFNGKPLTETDSRISAASIGYVMQSPEQQIVTDKVWHELTFGPENLGIPRDEIARRTAETASFFGIGEWYDRDTHSLSSGQKQLLNLASVLVMDPEVIVLDEPTVQLDPIAASDFITAIKRLNQELSMTVIIAEHRLEEIVPYCDRLIVMENGRIIFNAPPSDVIRQMKDNEQLMRAMPTASRLYSFLGDNQLECPMTVRQGRSFIESNFKNNVRSLPTQQTGTLSESFALEIKNVRFRYSRDSADILKDLDLKVKQGEIFSIVGGNGCGKTTSLKCASALEKPYSGTIRVFGKKLKEYKNRSLYNECLAMLPQDVQTVFMSDSVRDEMKLAKADISSLPFDISHLLDKHPYDLSGGEQQLAALARVLASRPKILLMDEPTKGLDASYKHKITGILHDLRDSGVTIVIVTHDIEFAAECSDRCGMFFDGHIVSVGTPTEFFAKNSFYTTAVSRMTRGIYDNIVTVEQAVEICRLNGRKDGRL